MKRFRILSPVAFVLLEVSVLLAQPSIPLITDARIEGDRDIAERFLARFPPPTKGV